MKKCHEPVDLMVGLGLMATILGAAFFFLAANGTVAISLSEADVLSGDASTMDPMASVQAAMGEAIVNHAVNERRAGRQMKRAVLDLNRALISAEGLRGEAEGGLLTRLAAYDQLTRTREATRGQFVRGRRIVTETGRGLRSGIYGAVPQGERYNRRVVRTAERDGARIERGLQVSHEPVMGQFIATAGLEQRRLLGMAEQRKGEAIVGYATTQAAAVSSRDSAQQQLAALSMALIRQEQIMDRFESLAQAQIPPPGEALAVSEPKSWSVPGGLLTSFAIVAIGILAFCFAMFRGREEDARPEPMPLPEAQQARYRQAV